MTKINIFNINNEKINLILRLIDEISFFDLYEYDYFKDKEYNELVKEKLQIIQNVSYDLRLELQSKNLKKDLTINKK